MSSFVKINHKFMTIRKFIFPILLIFSISCVSVLAQKKKAVNENLPYKVGETLSYEGNYSKLVLRGIDVAEVNFTVENAPDSKNYLVKAEAKSKGGLLKLFSFKFYQNIESTIDANKLQVIKTMKRDEQGDDRIRISQADFDYKTDKVTYIETDPNDTARPPRVVASKIEEDTQDLISGIYMLRYLPLAVGKTFEISISDSGLVYKVPVRVTAREKRKSVLGKKWCFRLEPEVFGENRLIENEGSLTIWITDDKERLPIRANIETSIGKIVVKLKEITNNKIPQKEAK